MLSNFFIHHRWKCKVCIRLWQGFHVSLLFVSGVRACTSGHKQCLNSKCRLRGLYYTLISHSFSKWGIWTLFRQIIHWLLDQVCKLQWQIKLNVFKLFLFVTDEDANLCIHPSQVFNAGLMFVSEVWACRSGASYERNCCYVVIS
jgi:hypothetical protein